MLPGMVEAQRLRDAALARAALAALDTSRARSVVVITGNGHAANDLGVPSLLRMQPGEVVVASVGQFEETAPDTPDFDHWFITPTIERGDPCEAFKN